MRVRLVENKILILIYIHFTKCYMQFLLSSKDKLEVKIKIIKYIKKK